MTALIDAVDRKEPSAAELLTSVPGVDIWFATILEDFAVALDQCGAFADLSWSDARRVAKAIADDITGRGHPRERLVLHASTGSSDDDEPTDLDNAGAVRRALATAAALSAKGAYGIRWM